MSNIDEFVETVVASIKYGFSNMKTIIIYGVLSILAIALFFAGFIAVALFHKSIAAWVFLGLASIPILLLTLLTMGYWVRCLRSLVGGGDKLPDFFTDFKGLVIDGIKGLIIYLEMVVVSIILYMAVFGLMFVGIRSQVVFLFISLLLFAFVMVAILVLLFINIIQWTVYAGSGSLLKGLNPFEAIGLILANPMCALVAAAQAFVIYIVFSVAITVLSILIVPLILLPFLTMPVYVAMLYVIAKFYMGATGHGTLPAATMAEA